MHSHKAIYSTAPFNANYPIPDLENKKILIVGAGSGIAFSIIEELKNSNLNLYCTFHNLKPVNLDNNMYPLDISNPTSIDELVEIFRAENIKFDSVILCTGIIDYPQTINQRKEWNDINQVYLTNLIGPHYFILRMIPMLNNGSSVVVLSGGGASNPMKYFPAYSSSKTGIVRLVETLALEFSNFDVNINALGPGPIKTSMTMNLLSNDKLPNEIRESISNQIPGKNGFFNGKLTARCVMWLISDTFKGVSGKFFSAQWDDWTEPAILAERGSQCGQNFSLRRVGCENSITK